MTGIIAVNPWIRLEKMVAREQGFWNRIRHSEERYLGAARSLTRLLRNAIPASRTTDELKARVVNGLSRSNGKVCIILGGEDPATTVFQHATADEVSRLTALGRLTVYKVPGADHVFSGNESRRLLIEHSVNWTLNNVR